MLTSRAIEQYASIRFCIPEELPSGFPVLSGWSPDLQAEMNKRVSVERDLLGLGKSIIRAAFSRSLERHRSNSYVALLSGGLDSRGVIGGLLEHLSPSEIACVTYGDRASLDIHFARKVAGAAGLNHEILYIEDMDWSFPSLLETIDQNGVFPVPKALGAGFCKTTARRLFGADQPFFLGVTGDALGGARYSRDPHSTWGEEVDAFLGRVQQHRLPGDRPATEWFPAEPPYPNDLVRFKDQVDLAVFQPNLVCANKPAGYTDVAPFQDGEWAAFMLALPVEMRRDQKLYQEVLSSSFPQVFKTEVTTTLRRRYHSRTSRALAAIGRRLLPFFGLKGQFFDGISVMLRPGGKLHNDAVSALRSLADRQLIDWIDIDGLAEELAAGKATNASLIRTMVSLELNLMSVRRAPSKRTSVDV